MKPVVFGCAGIGGFAGSIVDRLLAHGQTENPSVRLTAVCDPDPQRNPTRVAALNQAGVKVLTDFAQLLAEPVEAVWLPLPIHLHRPFTERALAAGKSVMCEKPAAGAVQDVDGMIAARDRARLPVAIGFQDVYQPANLALKKRLLSGELGRPRHATLVACWPRGDKYYARNNWAGVMRRDGTWVLDSPASNALAHFIHLVLYLLGPSIHEAAAPVALEAELYRANPIENYDTCSMRLRLPGDIDFVLALTHACAETIDPEIELITEHARVRVLAGKPIEIHLDEAVETIGLEGGRYGNVIDTFARIVRGEHGTGCGATLEMARAHVLTVNGASAAAAVHDVPTEFVTGAAMKDGSPVRAVRDLAGVLRECVHQRRLLHETGRAPWSRPAAGIDLSSYTRFDGPSNGTRRARTVGVNQDIRQHRREGRLPRAPERGVRASGERKLSRRHRRREQRAFFHLHLFRQQQRTRLVRLALLVELDLVGDGRREPHASHHPDFATGEGQLWYVGYEPDKVIDVRLPHVESSMNPR